MHGISVLLEMAASVEPDRVAVQCDQRRWTTAELDALTQRAAAVLVGHPAASIAYVGLGGSVMPLLLFAAARSGLPFAPLNYRLSTAALDELIGRLPDPLVIVDPEYRSAVSATARVIDTTQFLAAVSAAEPGEDAAVDPDDVAVLLFTSGTTSAPKAVELSHANLSSYILGSVEFASATADDAALIAVPPYHIAGVSAALSNLYAGRRMVYLRRFDAAGWVRTVRDEKISTATVVPTMLDRIVTALHRDPQPLPTLKALAYGGAKVPQPLLRRALDLLPDTGFVNAYGLTETSSTIAVLGPEDHRAAHRSTEHAVARRLASVGRPLPGVEIEIRDEDGRPLGPGTAGELFVRGEQVSGRYAELGSALDAQGWFPTRDRAEIDDEGYLFITGRADDTIIRGGENIAPAEVEDVLIEHPLVRDVAVVGAADDQWGQIIVAVVVPEAGASPPGEELRAFVRERLRGSRTPDRVVFRDELPATATGKVLRKDIVASLSGE